MAQRSGLLAKFARAVAESRESESLSWRLCDASRQVLGADGASITVDNDSPNRVTLSATDQMAAKLEDLQDVLVEGPCLDAYRTGTVIEAHLPAEADRWPLFVEAALRTTNADTMVALPMRSGDAILGVLSLYMVQRRSLAEPPEAALLVADALAVALLHDPEAHSDLGIGGSWSNRAVVHQATGMVVAQLRLPVRDALAVLRAHAFVLDTDLGEVAQAVVDRTLVLEREGRA